MTGRVYLVGAGCGSADLLTLRGRDRLARCDAVVYDDLIDPALLSFAPSRAERIYMGKRRGARSAPQEEINAKLVELASTGQVVVRLKGGDPFVFGRGGEEVAALQRARIPFEVVPGISSPIAIPAQWGIPVTHRGVSRSFHVITGHTAQGDGLPPDLPLLAAGTGTLIFLMGLKKLPLIAQTLMEHGRSPHTPAAVLSGGNSPHPAAVRGTLEDIARLAADVLPPAVILVGEVAALDFSGTLAPPLGGMAVGVTGTPSITDKLTTHLSALGARVIPVAPTRVVERPPSPLLAQLGDGGAKWLVLTSPNGVEVFFRQLRAAEVDLRRLGCCSFAAIGRATGAALAVRGIFPDLCPETHTSAALAAALVEQVPPGQPIYLLRSARGAEVLRALPQGAGHPVTDIPLYDILPREVPAPDLRGLDYLTFSSAGGVEEFFRRYGDLPPTITPVCIGEVTARALAARCDRPPLLPRATSGEGLVQAITEDWLHRKKQV